MKHNPQIVKAAHWALLRLPAIALLAGVALAGVTAPQIQPGGVVNSASFQGPLARGEMATIFGSNFAAGSTTAQAAALPPQFLLAGVNVSVGAIPAPITFVSATQINFEVPFEVPAGATADVVVTVGGVASAPLTVQMADYAVGIFMYARTPTVLDPIVYHYSTHQLVTPSNPANANEILIVYATGIGKLTNAPTTGQGAPSDPPAAAVDTPVMTLGGASVYVSFAGLAPGSAGLVQINIQLPSTLLAGYRLPLVINLPSDSSSPVDLAVAGDGGQAATLALSTNSLAFGNVTIGQTANLPLTVSNEGNIPLNVGSVAVTGTGFSVAGGAPFSLQPGGSQTVTASYAPTAATASSGKVTIASNDANSPSIVSLSGSGVAPPSISIAPGVLTFGSVVAGQTGTLTLTISNNGSSELIINSFSSSNPRFALVNASTPLDVDPGTSQTVTIGFSPTSTGMQTGGLTILSNDAVIPSLSLNMTGTGVGSGGSPAIQVTPATLSFGSILTGQTKDLSLTINNTGNATLTVNSITSSNPAFTVVVAPRPSGVPPGAFQYVAVRFSAASASAQSGTITIASNAPLSPSVTIGVSGTGTAPSVTPVINVTPVNLNFGQVATGQSSSLTVTVSNSGTGPLTVNSITSSNALFTSTTAMPFTVAPGASQPVSVTFSTTAPGGQMGTLTIASSDPVTPSALVYLTATGFGAALIPSINVTPTTLTFGSVNNGQTATQNLMIFNTGTAPLNVSALTSSNSLFTLTNLTAPFTVAPGSFALAVIQFAPVAPGAQSGTLTITSNDPATPSVTVSVTGTGAGPAVAPSISVTPTTLSFGTVASGTTSDLTLFIVNDGNAALTVTALTSSNTLFSVVGPAVPFTVPAGTSQAADIRFSPTSTAAQTGNLTIASNDPAHPTLIVPLTGNPSTGGGGGGGTTQTITLKVDGGTFDAEIGYPAGTASAFFVNRLTPPSYPATIQSVEIYFSQRGDGLSLDTPINIFSATNPGGSSTLAFGATPDQVSATVSAFGSFVTYTVPQRTITSGDFVVGFEVQNPPNILPADEDQITTSQQRSYASSDGVTFLLLDTQGSALAGNLAIRAVVTIPQ